MPSCHDGAEEALDRLVRADRGAELVRTDGGADEIRERIARPRPDEHDPDHRATKLEAAERRHERLPLAREAQQHHVGERIAEIEHARDGDRRVDERHAPVQQHAQEEGKEHDARRDRHRLLRVAEPRAAPEQHEPKSAERERAADALVRKRAHVLKPRDERKHERERAEERAARLDDEGRQCDTDDACDDSRKQKTAPFLSTRRPAGAASRQAGTAPALTSPVSGSSRRSGASAGRNRRSPARTPPA